MPDVKTNALMPKGDDNGLSSIATELAAEARRDKPARMRAVLGIIDPRRATVDKDTGDWLVTVRFRRVEVLLAEDLPAAEKLIRRALEHRSGQTTLPLELEDEIRAAFADIDPDAEDQDQDEDEGGAGDDDDPE